MATAHGHGSRNSHGHSSHGNKISHSSHGTHHSSHGGHNTSSSSRKQNDIQQAVTIIENRLYFLATRYRPKNSDNIHFFSIDNVLLYEPFFVDFGPLNLGCLYKFCGLVKHKLKDPRYSKSRIYYYCDKDPHRIGNAAYLIGAFQVIELGRHPIKAYEIVKSIALKAVPFRDASMGMCSYKCTVEHCLWAIHRSLQRKYLDFNKFNVDEYQHYERVECGDLNIIIPNKFIAFAGPHYKEFDDEGYPALTPQFYLPIWKKFGVTTIVRLNKKCYDKRVWTSAGYEHFDLYFIDGTTPNDTIIRNFLQICENAKGVCAIHCKAGLGRTGSLLGCYFMKHFCWKASECIAWLRICRPGSVIGPQQQFLEKQQPIMWREGDAYRKKHGIQLEHDPRIEDAQIALEKSKQKEFTARFLESQKMGNTKTNDRSASNNNNNNGNNNSNSAKSNHLNNGLDEKEDNLPLATDPGQRQGQALLNSKRQRKGEYMPKHLFTPENSASDLNSNNDNNNNPPNGGNGNNQQQHKNGYRSTSNHNHGYNNNKNNFHNYNHGHNSHSHGHSQGRNQGHGQHHQSSQGYGHQQQQHQQYQNIHGSGGGQSMQSSKGNPIRSQSSGTPNRSSNYRNSNGN